MFTHYPVIYSNEVLVHGSKVSHASSGFSPQRRSRNREPATRCFSLEEARAEEESEDRMEDILAILNIILCMLCNGVILALNFTTTSALTAITGSCPITCFMFTWYVFLVWLHPSIPTTSLPFRSVYNKTTSSLWTQFHRLDIKTILHVLMNIELMLKMC